MKKSYKVISILLALALIFSSFTVFAFAENGKEYHFIDSVAGDDSNSGRDIYHPVKTINGLKVENWGPGTTILFKNGGEYECAASLTCSGTKENPVVISSYGEGERAILKTDEKKEILCLFDCSYVTISKLHFKAPNGGGLWIDALTKTSEGITIENVKFTDIQNYEGSGRDNLSAGAATARAAIMVKGLPSRTGYAVNDLTIRNCEVYNCANGFSLWGPGNDSQGQYYNKNTLVENCYFHEMDAEAVIVGICDGALVTNCRAINCCQADGLNEDGTVKYYTAAMWFFGSTNSTIQYCEIAGQKNVGDGMAIDFDSGTSNCTYQYIYSHDNMRFMCNCPSVPHSGNTVRYCLSVNDNGGGTNARSTTATFDGGEHNFRFYNNTIVNCGDFHFFKIFDSVIANNIFVLADGAAFGYDMNTEERNNKFMNNCYYKVLPPLIDLQSKNTVPGFAGANLNDPLSFALSKDSPLIGAGVKIEGDDSATDLFGNKITSQNIGCFGTDGVDTEYKGETLIEKILRIFFDILETLRHELAALGEEIGDWIEKLK